MLSRRHWAGKGWHHICYHCQGAWKARCRRLYSKQYRAKGKRDIDRELCL